MTRGNSSRSIALSFVVLLICLGSGYLKVAHAQCFDCGCVCMFNYQPCYLEDCWDLPVPGSWEVCAIQNVDDGGTLCIEYGGTCYIPDYDCEVDPPFWSPPPYVSDVYPEVCAQHPFLCIEELFMEFFDMELNDHEDHVGSMTTGDTNPGDIRRRIAAWVGIPEADVKLREYASVVAPLEGLDGAKGVVANGTGLLPYRSIDAWTDTAKLDVCTFEAGQSPQKVATVTDLQFGETVLVKAFIDGAPVVVALTTIIDTVDGFDDSRVARQAALKSAAEAIIVEPRYTLELTDPLQVPCR